MMLEIIGSVIGVCVAASLISIIYSIMKSVIDTKPSVSYTHLPGACPPERITPTTCFFASDVFAPFWKVISFLP